MDDLRKLCVHNQVDACHILMNKTFQRLLKGVENHTLTLHSLNRLAFVLSTFQNVVMEMSRPTWEGWNQSR